MGFLTSLLEAFFALFKPKSSPPPPPPVQPPPTVPSNEPAAIVVRKVLMIVYDPIIDASTGLKLSQYMNWRKPDDLAASFLADILETSNGLARYQIMQRVELNEFPVKVDGFRYTAESYLAYQRRQSPAHEPDLANYNDLLQKFNILQRVASNEIDEVWVFAFPHAGFYESIMGGYGAFWCNANPLAGTSTSPRRFIIMGFSYERGVGEMLESFNHRVESIMEQVYRPTRGEANLWKRFTRYDLSHPDKAEVGTVHFAPNSTKDYEWGNPRVVNSGCDDWSNYPNFKGIIRPVNAQEWGNGDPRQYHRWWLRHIPKYAGQLNGIANNWWQYMMDVNRVKV